MSEEIRDPRDRERSPEEISEWLATAKDPTTPPRLLVSLTSDLCDQIAIAAQQNPNLPSDFLRLAIQCNHPIACWANPLAMQAALELGDLVNVQSALRWYFEWKYELDGGWCDFSALKMAAEGWWTGTRNQLESCIFYLRKCLEMEKEADEMALSVPSEAPDSLILELFPTFPLAHLISTGEDPSHG